MKWSSQGVNGMWRGGGGGRCELGGAQGVAEGVVGMRIQYQRGGLRGEVILMVDTPV
jgi:hypothetical protein